MTQRIGLRLNPTSGTVTLGLPLGGDGYGFSLDGSPSYEYVAPDVTDAGGGTTQFFGPFGARSGLRKAVSSGAPWTIWFDPVAGSYTGITIIELDASDNADIRARVILETDGIESVVADQTQATLEGAGSTIFAAFSVTSAFVIGAVAPSAFWTDFEKTKENAP